MESMLTTTLPSGVPAREKQPRRYELDWCRAFVVLALIPIHAAGLFTFAVTLAAYELLIRRTPPLRALFGMRLRLSPTSSPAERQEPVRAQERRAGEETKGERRESGKRT